MVQLEPCCLQVLCKFRIPCRTRLWKGHVCCYSDHQKRASLRTRQASIFMTLESCQVKSTRYVLQQPCFSANPSTGYLQTVKSSPRSTRYHRHSDYDVRRNQRGTLVWTQIVSPKVHVVLMSFLILTPSIRSVVKLLLTTCEDL